MGGKGAIAFGIVCSIAGLVICGVSARKAYDDYKNMDKYYSGHMELKDSSKIKVSCGAGNVTVHHSDTTTSYVDYTIADYYKFNYDEENGEISLEKKWRFWFMFDFANKNTMDVYLTDKDYDAYFKVSAGKFNVEGDYTFNSLTVEVSAGDFNFNGNATVNENALFKVSAGDLNMKGNVNVAKKAELKVSAGDLNVNYVEADNVFTKISAGDIKCKVKSSDIEFDISAGDLVMDIVGKEEDYSISIDKSAGSCNVNGRTGGSKRLDGDISAGKATIHFVNE